MSGRGVEAVYGEQFTAPVRSYEELAKSQLGRDYNGNYGDLVVETMNMRFLKAMGVHNRFASEEAFEDAFSNLTKAISNDGVAGFADATALRLENLDDTMTKVLYTNEHLVLWSWLERVVSTQPLYQYNRKLRYGGQRRSPGFQEGGTPRSSTSAYERLFAQVRYLGVRRGITHQLLTTQLLGGLQEDLSTQETSDGTIDLLAITERWALHGLSSIKPAGGTTINYDGIFKQLDDALGTGEIDDRNIIDKAGQPLTFDDIEEMALTYRTVGKLTSAANLGFFVHPTVSQGLSLQKLPAERAALTSEVSQGKYVSGLPLAGFRTGLGVINFKDSIFLEEVEDNKALIDASEIEPTAPASPTTCVANSGVDALATWSGTFYYGASALNDGGESLATIDVSSQAIVAGQKADITISRVHDAHGYRIYRGTESDGSDAKHIATIPQPSSGNATYADKNQKIPGTHDCVCLHNDPADLVVAQMAPLTKFQLAPISTTLEFLLLLYHTIVVKSPKRQIRFKNVGSYIA